MNNIIIGISYNNSICSGMWSDVGVDDNAVRVGMNYAAGEVKFYAIVPVCDY
jgi:hypothetical protein